MSNGGIKMFMWIYILIKNIYFILGSKIFNASCPHTYFINLKIIVCSRLMALAKCHSLYHYLIYLQVFLNV